MNNTMGIILTGGKNNRLKELSMERSISAVPLAEYCAVISPVNMINQASRPGINAV